MPQGKHKPLPALPLPLPLRNKSLKVLKGGTHKSYCPRAEDRMGWGGERKIPPFLGEGQETTQDQDHQGCPTVGRGAGPLKNPRDTRQCLACTAGRGQVLSSNWCPLCFPQAKLSSAFTWIEKKKPLIYSIVFFSAPVYCWTPWKRMASAWHVDPLPTTVLSQSGEMLSSIFSISSDPTWTQTLCTPSLMVIKAGLQNNK